MQYRLEPVRSAWQGPADFSEELQNSAQEIRAARVSPVDKKNGSAAAAKLITVSGNERRKNVMKIHKMNEKNQGKERSKVGLSDLSKEEMRSAMGGIYETSYKIKIRGIQYTIGLNRTRTL